MAVSFGCKCDERRKPVKERNWVVITRRGNFSAFNGYKFTHSDWSEVACNTCGEMGRTKAGYVYYLKDGEYDHNARNRYYNIQRAKQMKGAQ